MNRRDLSNRTVSALRAALACPVLVALYFLVPAAEVSEPATAPPLSAALPAPDAAAGSERAWAVAVDGWRIEVDGVAVDPSRLAPVGDLNMNDLGLPRLALYADSIARYADEEALDWRLVAAVIAEESAFQPKALSPAGAFGLMQVREAAAREVGVFPYAEPDANVRAGVRYLAAMRAAFAGATPHDTRALMLAAYNMGPGHLRDARQLAAELGYDPLVWQESVASIVLLLEQPAFYEETRHGFARGGDVVRYVERVLTRYGAYRRRFPATLTLSPEIIAEIAG